jgi:uroporphyrinogen-III synthase
MRHALVLRPESGASTTIERLRRLGVRAMSVPLFRIDPVAWRAPDPRNFDGLLLTSASAVRMAGGDLMKLRQLPAFAVGEATAQVARSCGFDVRSAGKGGVDSLLESIPADLRLLHLCGEHRKAPGRARQPITSVVVYSATEIDQPDLGDAPGAVVLVHSPRAGTRFASLVGYRATVSIAAISQATADSVGAGWQSVSVAAEPDDEALLALAFALCEKPAPQ